MEIAIIAQSGLFAAVGGILIGLWHDIKDSKLPAYETTESSDAEKKKKKKQTRANLHERGAFVFACAILSGFIGAMIGLYYLGFMDDESLPNVYGRAFIAFGSGFLMPKIFEHTESLSISKLINKFFK